MTAKFEATFAGNPKPTVTWLKDGEELANSRKVQMRVKGFRTTLALIDVADEDVGYYVCKVSNDVGTDTSRAGLTLSSKCKLQSSIGSTVVTA